MRSTIGGLLARAAPRVGMRWTEQRGRVIYAMDGFSAGDTVLVDRAAALAVLPAARAQACSQCAAPLPAGAELACPQCDAWYCSEGCATGAEPRHNIGCGVEAELSLEYRWRDEALRRRALLEGIFPFLAREAPEKRKFVGAQHAQCAARLLILSRLGDERAGAVGELASLLGEHPRPFLDQQLLPAAARLHRALLAARWPVAGPGPPTLEETQHALGVLLINAFAVPGPAQGPDGGESVACAVFPAASMLSHACAPNCTFAVRGPSLAVVAGRAIGAGEELSISYAGMAPRRLRRPLLLRDKLFWCRCEACSLPDTTDAWPCPSCSDGYLFPEESGPGEAARWRCSACGEDGGGGPAREAGRAEQELAEAGLRLRGGEPEEALLVLGALHARLAPPPRSGSGGRPLHPDHYLLQELDMAFASAHAALGHWHHASRHAHAAATCSSSPQEGPQQQQQQ
eukprot:tig00000718_g3700.t1